MGYLKQRQLEQNDAGYSMPAAGAVCAACTGEPDLARFVDGHLTYDACDLCGRESDAPIAADTDEVLRHIGESLQLEYEDANAVLPWDRESSTGLFGASFDTEDAIEHAGSVLEHEEFAQLVAEAFVDSRWCERDPFAPRKHEQLIVDWLAFRRLTETRVRFLFLLADFVDGSGSDAPVYDAGQMLAEIGRCVEDISLARRLSAGSTFIRARVHGASESLEGAAALGTAPRDVAGDSRMSAAGIPVFYGAQDPTTARAETVDEDMDLGKVITMGTFETTRETWLVDLSELPELPGIFDEDHQQHRSAIRFLQAFRDDISQRVRPDRQIHPEYVPTQIVTEYLRHVVRAPDGERFDGVIYPSARRPGSECVAMFVAPEDCIDANDVPAPDRLQLQISDPAQREDIT